MIVTAETTITPGTAVCEEEAIALLALARAFADSIRPSLEDIKRMTDALVAP